jgi:hypothetical protein
MADADRGRLDAIYLALIAFLVLVAAARTAYIGLSPAPVPFAAIHWLFAGAMFGFGWLFSSRRYHPVIKALGPIITIAATLWVFGRIASRAPATVPARATTA